MSASKNLVILIGNVGQDPEIRYTQQGAAVANLSLATSENWKDQSGEKQERTEWHKLVAWREKAELINQYVHKGDKIYIEGSLQTRSWEDKEGNKHYTTEIVVRNIEFLGSRQQGGDAPEEEHAGAAAGGSSSADLDDGLPF